ncbi:MAG TPA: isoprenyl transferase [Candidatus Kapabacteria bacterium]|nr:isoprenyl transferase [Candidatus Kapabacteria bacterium]
MRKFLVPDKYQQPEDDKRVQLELRARGKLPHHIAVIMDGNGRWAEERGLPRAAGHQAGIASLRDVTRSSRELGIGYLTVYAFSTENWKRPKREVSMLFRLLVKMLREELAEMLENGVRLKTIGQTSLLPKLVQQELNDAIQRTSNNKGLTLTLALSYSGRWDLVHAMQAIAMGVRSGKISPEDISEETIRAALTTAEMPDPDLLVRTSGELRLSNFLLWELAYSEIHVTNVLWPDFRREHLYEAIREYQKRERRFGLTGAQLKQAHAGSDIEVPEAQRSYVEKMISRFTRGKSEL